MLIYYMNFPFVITSKFFRSKWNQNPLTQGSYTFIPTGSSVDDVYNLSKPVVIILYVCSIK